nr:unnamed protein product [Callosobruchus analis]
MLPAASPFRPDKDEAIGEHSAWRRISLQCRALLGNNRHRSNHSAESPSEFWKRSLIIPYLDSVITSLETRFADENTT